MVLDSPWTVHTLHLNVDQGDSALHVRQVTVSGQTYVNSLVLIDGGIDSYAIELDTLLSNLGNLGYQRPPNGPFVGCLDAIVVTHWDADHMDGVCGFLSRHMINEVHRWLGNQPIPPNSQALQNAIDQCVITCPFIIYKQALMKPRTQFYGPNLDWTKLPQETYTLDTTHRYSYQFDTEFYDVSGNHVPYCVLVLGIEFTHNNQPIQLAVKMPFARLGPFGSELICWDCFDDSETITPQQAKSPKDISQWLEQNNHGPAMVCVAADEVNFCDPDGVADRDKMVWVQKNNYKSLGLVMDPKAHEPDGWSVIPFCETNTIANSADNADPPASVQVIKAHTSDVNQASIALMIIWPNSAQAQVSHYLGGDLGWEVEERILRWSTIPYPEDPHTRARIRVRFVKLSHHGSKASTPLLMLFAWKPRTIFCSNGTNLGDNLISWDTLLYIDAWSVWRKKFYNEKIGPRYFGTNVPGYLCRYWSHINNKFKTAIDVGNVESALRGTEGKPWRRMLKAMKDLGLSLPDLNDVPNGQAEILGRQICDALYKNWDKISPIGLTRYGINCYNSKKAFGLQALRLLFFETDYHTTEVAFFVGLTMANLTREPAYTDIEEEEEADIDFASSGVQPGQQTTRLINDKTRTNIQSGNLCRKPTGLFSSKEAVEVMIMDGPYTLERDDHSSDATQGHEAATDVSQNEHNDLRNFKTDARFDDASPFYFMSSDAFFVDKTYPFGNPTKLSNVDLFLGGLATGAFVLPADPSSQKQPSSLHETDELLQWLSLVLEGADAPYCQITATFNQSSIASLQLLTKLGSFFKDAGFPATIPLTFSTDYNTHAFTLKQSLDWPAVDPSTPDIVGNAQVLCLSLGPKADIYDVEFTGQHIMSAAGFKTGPIEKVLTSLVKFNINPTGGSKNTIWFSSDSIYTTTLRLCFIPSQKSGDALDKLVGNVSDFLSSIGIKLAIKFEDPQVILKRTWTNQMRPFTVANVALIKSWIKLEHIGQTLRFETGIMFEPESTSWILNFDSQNSSDPEKDPDKDRGETRLSDLLNFLKDLFGLKDAVPDMTTYLPGFNKIMIRRVMYTKFVSGSWSLKIDLQVVIASMAFLCSALIQDKDPKFSFFGRLFPEDRPGEKGLGDTFNYLPYLPDWESWDDLSFISTKEASKGSDVGRLENLYGAADGQSGSKLPDAPFDFRLVQMELRLVGPVLGFGATVICPAPDPTKYAIPPIRLGAASLNLSYDFSHKQIQNFTLQTLVRLTSPKTLDVAKIVGSVSFQRSGTVIVKRSTRVVTDSEDSDYAVIEKKNDVEQRIADGTWVFTGSVFGLRGSLIYSLFDDDCNSEMIQLLENIMLDLRVVYKYAGKVGTEFNIDGTLHLGKLKLHCFYNHRGKKNGQPDWDFGADLAVTGQKSDLLSVIESVCGADISKALPACVKNVEVAPNQDKSLTSLKLARQDDWLVVYIRIQLTDNASIAIYQIQRKIKTTDTDPPPTKRVVMLQFAALPKIEGIPVVGDLSLPFTQIQFLFVNSSKDTEEGLTEEEVTFLNQKKPNGFASINFKSVAKGSDKKPAEKGKSAEAVLPNGFHFMILNEDKTLLDYLFGRPKPKGKVQVSDENVGGDDQGLTPFNKKLGPVTISAIGLKFDLKTQTLTFLVNGSVTLGPLELDLIGFGVSFQFGEKTTLRNLSGLSVSFTLAGLGLSFTKNPVVLAGYLEHSKSDDLEVFQGGATIGFDPWMFQAGGYYAKRKKDKASSLHFADDDSFKCFMAYASLSGPIATIGYAEIREVTCGLGYNTSLTFPAMENIMDFPFIADKPSNASLAIQALFSKKWMSLREGSNWVAAGMTVLAFQMLTVRAVVVVEWDRNVKLGLFGLATADIPKQLDLQFAKVQLGIAATIDFDAGTMKIDGQLTPASFVLHPSCHLTGGFALYSWFGTKNGTNQGDWVFSIGGYHSLFQIPSQYPNPPRLGISWSYDKNINITGQAYFAITPKVCMGGGRLQVTFTLGSLYAYFDAYADFLINYKPFHYQAQGGVSVGVKYTLDLWLVSLPISVDLGAQLWLEGNPMSGKVHVDFWVFGFDVNFGAKPTPPKAICGDKFWDLVLQADTSGQPALLPASAMEGEDVHEEADTPAAHVFACTSGLIPKGDGASKPSGDPWTVRAAIFKFSVSFKFPVKTAAVITQGFDGKDMPEEPVDNRVKKTDIYAKPMHLEKGMPLSDVKITIKPDVKKRALEDDQPVEIQVERWTQAEASYSKLPTTLWGQYDKSTDPNEGAGNSNPTLLNGKDVGTVELMTGITLQPPPADRSKDLIPEFSPEKALKDVVAQGWFVKPQPAEKAWNALVTGQPQFKEVKDVWTGKEEEAKDVTDFWEGLDCFDWIPKPEDSKEGKGGKSSRRRLNWARPKRLVEGLERILVESPVLCAG